MPFISLYFLVSTPDGRAELKNVHGNRALLEKHSWLTAAISGQQVMYDIQLFKLKFIFFTDYKHFNL
jgi:hypothetical protein